MVTRQILKGMEKLAAILLVAVTASSYGNSYTLSTERTFMEGSVQAGAAGGSNSDSCTIIVPDGMYARVSLSDRGSRWYHCESSSFVANLNGRRLTFGSSTTIEGTSTINISMTAVADKWCNPYNEVGSISVAGVSFPHYYPSYHSYTDYYATQAYSISVSYVKKLPDIHVTAVSLSASVSAEDEAVTLSFNVGNSGWLNAGDVSVVRIYDGDVQICKDISIAALERNASSRQIIQLPTLAVGTHKIRIVADATGKIDESAESNNEATASLRVYRRAPVGVTYDLNGGGPPQTVSVVAGERVENLPDATRPGYDFKGWWTAATGGTQIDSAEKITEARTFYAHWSARETQIDLNRQHGGRGTQAVTARYDQSMPNIAIPVRTGYVFGGYWSEPGGNGTQYYSSSGGSVRSWNVDTPQITLFAKWSGLVVAISLDRQGGVGGTTSVSAEYSCPLPSITPPSRNGWNFQGYFSEPDGMGIQCYDAAGEAAATCTLLASTTFYAHWLPCQMDYALTLDLQGGNGVGSVTATYRQAMPAITPPRRDRYVFRGYFSEPNGGGSRYYNEDGSSAALWDSVTTDRLYAFWEKAYHVVLSGNGAEAAPQTQYFPTDRWELEDPPFVRSGYEIAGWSLRPDGPPLFPCRAVLSKDVLGYGDDPDADEVTLYAVWGRPIAPPNLLAEGVTFHTGGETADSGWFEQDGIVRSARKSGKSWICASFDGCGDMSSICTNAIFDTAVLDFSFFTDGHLYTNSFQNGLVRDFSVSDGHHLATWCFSKNLTDTGWEIVWGSHGFTEDESELQAIIEENDARVAELQETVVGNVRAIIGSSYSSESVRAVVAEAFAEARANESIGYLRHHVANKVISKLHTNKLKQALDKYENSGIDTPGIVSYVRCCNEAFALMHGGACAFEYYMASYAVLTKLEWRRTYQVLFMEDSAPDYAGVQKAHRAIHGIQLAYEDLKDPIAETATWLLAPSGYSFSDANRAACRQMIKDCLESCWVNENVFVQSALNSSIGASGLGLKTSIYYGALSGSTGDPEYLRLGRRLKSLVARASALLSDKTQLWDRMKECGVLEMNILAGGSRLGTLPVPSGRDGLSFGGWYTTSGQGPVNAQTVINCDTMFFARWTTNMYTITFNSRGGTAVDTQTRAHGEPLGVLPTPTLEGYAFAGWYADLSYDSAIAPYAPITANGVLYAQWTLHRDLDLSLEATMTNGGASLSWGETRIDPDPGDDVVGEWNAGHLDTGFAKAQTVLGALCDEDGVPMGTVQVKVGKVSKKGVVKISATATLLVDGKAKKVSAKAVSIVLDATGRVPSVAIAFKEPIGNMAFEMEADGTFKLKNARYVMAEKKVGGNWTRAGARVWVDGGRGATALPAGTIEELLPAGEPVIPKAGKWSFAKAATVKWAKPKKGAERPEIFDEASGKGLIVDDTKGKTNLSGLKLTYTPKTGIFKGSFKIYAIQGGKLKKVVVKVIGMVVDGKGWGSATGPGGVSFAVTVE